MRIWMNRWTELPRKQKLAEVTDLLLLLLGGENLGEGQTAGGKGVCERRPCVRQQRLQEPARQCRNMTIKSIGASQLLS